MAGQRRSGASDPPAGKAPPNSAEAEEAVLGSVLLDGAVINVLADTLDSRDFYRERNAVVYRAMLDLHRDDVPVDYLTLTDRLERDGLSDAAGGLVYLSGLLGAVPTSVHAEHYARIIRDYAVLRRLASAGSAIAALGWDASNDPKRAYEQAQRALESVEPSAANEGPRKVVDVLGEYLDHVREIEAEAVPPGIATGFTDLDAVLSGGMQRGNLLVVAARPSIGKTSLALNVIEHVASKGGACLLYSLEMPSAQIVGRMLSMSSGIESSRIRRGQWTDREVAQIGYAINALTESPVYVDDAGDLSVAQIRERSRRLHARDPLSLIVVDHIQLVAGGSAGGEENRTQEISRITRQLKAMSLELSVPVIAVSQLNRAVESRSDKVPKLSDLRESGSIEQDADVVLLLYRDDYYNPDSEQRGVAEVHVAKNRDGEAGVRVDLIFNHRTTRFMNALRY